jgi:hypothetical protein
MSGITLQRLEMVIEPEPGNPQEVEGREGESRMCPEWTRNWTLRTVRWRMFHNRDSEELSRQCYSALL